MAVDGLFFARHHIETSDGRYWTSLACAAHSAVRAGEWPRPAAIDRKTGREYKFDELKGYAPGWGRG